MASSSSSSSSPLMVSSSSSPRNWEYNVFTSFHGPDVRRTILSHLRKQFEENGITMFDDNGIERSQKIAPALKKAIKESRIAIVLLSKNYASSSWCLDELFEIMKCNEGIEQIVMTVFYGVDPSDVRKQTGDFGLAFNKTCDGKTEEQRQKWSQALTYVGTIAGEDFKNWDNEAKMIQKIASDVSNKLNSTPCVSGIEGKGSIVGVSFDVAEINELMISPMAFKSMYNLLFLKIYNNPWHTRKLHVPEDIEFPRHIRLFHWDGYPGKSLPLRFSANLVELNMERSKFEKLWEGKQPLENLKKMNLRDSTCLRELPDLSNATSLETLNIISCEALLELPSSIANLHQLKDLLTFSCKSLEVIPTLINLTSLDKINMTGCSRLRSFPDLPTNITQLQISETAVEETPASLRYCSRLEYVELSENDNLKTFATHLPTSVTSICLTNSGIERITDCISGLHNLTVLSLSSCKRLASLPELPGSLMFLDADFCISLESVSDPTNTPNAMLRFTNCIKLSRQARRAIIQGSFGHKCAVLPGRKVPKEFNCRARGNSLTISGSTFKRFKVCVVMSPDEQYYCKSVEVLCRWKVIGNSVKSGEITFRMCDSSVDCSLAIEHLFIFHISLPFSDSSEVSRKIVLKFSSIDQYVDIIKCGVKYLTDETDGSNNERYGDEDDILDAQESDEASDIKEEDYDSIGTSGYESGEASDTEDDEDRYKSEFGEGFEGFEGSIY